MIKYEIYSGTFAKACIKEVQVVSETSRFITIEEDTGFNPGKRRRVAKQSSWKNYYDTWEEAHKALLDMARTRIDNACDRYEEAEDFYQQVSELKP